MRQWPYTIRELIDAKAFTVSGEPAALVPSAQLEEYFAEYERLRSERSRFRDALREIGSYGYSGDHGPKLAAMAREALGDEMAWPAR